MFDQRLRPTPAQYSKITVVALIALCAIIVTGAAVRLTGSGLGCSDWPNCEEDKFVAALDFHPMVEFINRLITGLVSAAVIVAVLGSLRRRPRRRDLVVWSGTLVAGVVAQIIIGAFVTKTELKFSVVAVHFLVSMVLVWAATVLIDRAGRPDESATVPRTWTIEAKALVALGTAVLVSGALVTSAGPHPGARPDNSGIEQAVERLPIDFGSIVRVHSILVWCLCAAAIVAAVRIGTGRSHPGSLRARVVSQQLLVVIIAQGAIGYVQYFTEVPALLVGFHVAGATLVWVMALRFAFTTALDEDGVIIGHSHDSAESREPALT